MNVQVFSLIYAAGSSVIVASSRATHHRCVSRIPGSVGGYRSPRWGILRSIMLQGVSGSAPSIGCTLRGRTTTAL
jgi:hypothetical protein